MSRRPASRQAYRFPLPGHALITVWREGYGVAELRRDLIAGLILVALGLARLGNLIQFVPNPLVLGFTAGIAVVNALYDINGPLFFGAAEKAVASLRMVDTEIEVLLLDMHDVPSLDATAIVALQSLAEELRSQQVGLIFIGMPARMVMKLRRAGIYRESGRVAAVHHLDHAARLARRWLATRTH